MTTTPTQPGPRHTAANAAGQSNACINVDQTEPTCFGTKEPHAEGLSSRPLRAIVRAVSYDLAVLAVDFDATAHDVERQYDACAGPGPHPEGDLDTRIVQFYEELRAELRDFDPGSDSSPWMSTPLGTGIDHVLMCLSYGPGSDPAIERIEQWAVKWRLAVFDPQSRTAYLPDELSQPD